MEHFDDVGHQLPGGKQSASGPLSPRLLLMDRFFLFQDATGGLSRAIILRVPVTTQANGFWADQKTEVSNKSAPGAWCLGRLRRMRDAA
jgi:hypothetical protein